MLFTETDFADIADTASLVICGWAEDFTFYEPYHATDPDPHMTVVSEDEKFVITLDRIKEVISMIIDGRSGLRESIKNDIKLAVRQDDYGMIDATAADAIVQLACFDEIVYG